MKPGDLYQMPSGRTAFVRTFRSNIFTLSYEGAGLQELLDGSMYYSIKNLQRCRYKGSIPEFQKYINRLKKDLETQQEEMKKLREQKNEL
jgi:response regulator of citrate/malate metabolism